MGYQSLDIDIKEVDKKDWEDNDDHYMAWKAPEMQGVGGRRRHGRRYGGFGRRR